MAKMSILATAFIVLALNFHSIPNIVADQEIKSICPLEIKNYQASVINLLYKPQGPTFSTSVGGSMGEDVVKTQDKQLLLSMKCKNTAKKQITAVWWESRFIDLNENKVTKQFKSKKKINPGNDETIQEPLPYDFKLIPSMLQVGFRIMKIEYKDNSYCEECDLKDAEACFVYENYRLY